MATVVGLDTQAVKRCTCRKCASIIEYTDSELREASGSDMSGTGYTRYSLTCPKCGNSITVRED